MRLSQLQTEVETVVEYEGDTARMKVRPSVITAEYEDRMRGTTSAVEIASMLAELISFIDVTDDDGKPIPCTAESFAKLPLTFMMEMFKQAGQASRPDPQKGATSAAG
jgi:hypothetical protein